MQKRANEPSRRLEEESKNQQPADPTIKESLTVAEPVKVPSDEGWPEALYEFREGQWWVKELDAMKDLPGATLDQKRAVSVVHHMLASVASYGQPAQPAASTKFTPGDHVRKTKGSRWQGIVVGTYSTSLTPEGYAVESDTETGSVQIYPAAALESVEAEESQPMTPTKPDSTKH